MRQISSPTSILAFAKTKHRMNLADLTTLLLLLTGLVSGAIASASASSSSPWYLTALCALTGLLLSLLLAILTHKAAYKLLDSSANNALALTAYLLLPVVAIVATAALIFTSTVQVLNALGF